jgi:hypothetical protein
MYVHLARHACEAQEGWEAHRGRSVLGRSVFTRAPNVCDTYRFWR